MPAFGGVRPIELMDTMEGQAMVSTAEEFNVLINPNHPASAGITATKIRKWLDDSRLVKAV